MTPYDFQLWGMVFLGIIAIRLLFLIMLAVINIYTRADSEKPNYNEQADDYGQQMALLPKNKCIKPKKCS